jgi:hypothetical protein
MQDQYSSGDYLHPNPAGYNVMPSIVDLGKFGEFADGSNQYV